MENNNQSLVDLESIDLVSISEVESDHKMSREKYNNFAEQEKASPSIFPGNISSCNYNHKLKQTDLYKEYLKFVEDSGLISGFYEGLVRLFNEKNRLEKQIQKEIGFLLELQNKEEKVFLSLQSE